MTQPLPPCPQRQHAATLRRRLKGQPGVVEVTDTGEEMYVEMDRGTFGEDLEPDSPDRELERRVFTCPGKARNRTGTTLCGKTIWKFKRQSLRRQTALEAAFAVEVAKHTPLGIVTEDEINREERLCDTP